MNGDNELQEVRQALLSPFKKPRSKSCFTARVSVSDGEMWGELGPFNLHTTDLGGNCGMDPTA